MIGSYLKLLSALGIILILNTCGGAFKEQPIAKTVTDEQTQSDMLLGKGNLEQLRAEPYLTWFDLNYENYTPDPQVVEAIKPLIGDYEITVFMGTWCSDSKREVPKFVKLLELTGYPMQDVTLITMDRSKTTPENYEEGLEITNVPTFIFRLNGEEVNRVVEYPVQSLEADMLAILSGAPYKHSYDW